MCLKMAGFVASSVDSGQMLHSATSDQSLQWLLWSVCPNTYDVIVHVYINYRLLQQLLDVQKSYGEMLRKSIAEKKLQMMQLQ